MQWHSELYNESIALPSHSCLGYEDYLFSSAITSMSKRLGCSAPTPFRASLHPDVHDHTESDVFSDQGRSDWCAVRRALLGPEASS